METTLHYSATAYVVNDGDLLLHDHDTREHWLPPAGHLKRGEFPHECALREAREETGLGLTLVTDDPDVESPPPIDELPRPRHVRSIDIDTCNGEVVHRHFDVAYYARAANRTVQPEEGEVPPERWEWFTRRELETDDRVRSYEAEIGRRAIAELSR